MTPDVASKIPEVWNLKDPDPDWWKSAHLKVSLDACRETTRHHAKSFYFASFPLPKYKRLGAFVVYAYCRYIDDIIDDAPVADLAPTEDFLRKELAEILKGESTHDFAPALQKAHNEFGIPVPFWHDLIHGCCLDRQPQKLQTYEELELYCYYVASVVGLIMCCVFGVKDHKALPQAIEMGIALQLTNILRDVHEDWRKERCYLPLDFLKEFSLSYQDLDERKHDARWKDLMAREISRAQEFYTRGEMGLKAIPSDGSQKCALIMSRVYAGILDSIQLQDNNPFAGRAFVPFWRKCTIAAKALF
ncbi:MAG: phytoene/squalene synthase family protein [Opitutales bacterium]